MTRWCLCTILFLALPLPASAQSVTLPAKVEVPVAGLVIVQPEKVDGDSVAYFSLDAGLQVVPPDFLRDSTRALCVAVQPGTYRLRAVAAKVIGGKAAISPVAECLVVVGGVPPTPPEPGPGPGPKPPTPPTPGALRVLVLYESGDLSRMPAAQQAVLYAKSIRDYLDAKCVQDGKVKAWRIWDKDTDASKESKEWRDLLARPRTAVPWLIIQGSAGMHEGPLPATVDETLTLLRKWGG